MLSARDLPRCDLSDFLEARLERVLTEERAQRAALLGRRPEEVPTAQGLTVRVVNNVDRRSEVKPRFAEAFCAARGFPDAFLYKQKVVLLFQQIDGVDMCLYCLYLQEYGENAAPPNRKTGARARVPPPPQRCNRAATCCLFASCTSLPPPAPASSGARRSSAALPKPPPPPQRKIHPRTLLAPCPPSPISPASPAVYLSYLDSVKYFQPEGVSAAGRAIALRSLVYHEVLSGYLAYAKARGFLAIYIWACPPLQGDDYILYCHPGRQRTPRSDRLREWYLVMLRQARAEGTVAYISNLLDTYFEGGKDHRVERPSITDLPYLEGDYWLGEAENILGEMGPEGGGGGGGGGGGANGADGSGGGGFGALKGRKAGKESKRRLLSGAPAHEALLSRLGDQLQGMKEDLIVAHLYESCSHCRAYVDGAPIWRHPAPPARVVIRSERTFDGIALDRPGGESSRTVAMTRFQLCQPCYDREAGVAADGAKASAAAPRRAAPVAVCAAAAAALCPLSGGAARAAARAPHAPSLAHSPLFLPIARRSRWASPRASPSARSSPTPARPSPPPRTPCRPSPRSFSSRAPPSCRSARATTTSSTPCAARATRP
jgi:hypothetical protein